jgi:hypothetical protein
MPFRHPGDAETLRRFGVGDRGLGCFGEDGAHAGGGGLVEAVDGDHAVDHVGGDVGERPAREPDRDDGAAWITADGPDRPRHPWWAPERRDGQPGGPRRCAQTTSRLAEEESTRFHPTSIARGYDGYLGSVRADSRLPHLAEQLPIPDVLVIEEIAELPLHGDERLEGCNGLGPRDRPFVVDAHGQVPVSGHALGNCPEPRRDIPVLVDELRVGVVLRPSVLVIQVERLDVGLEHVRQGARQRTEPRRQHGVLGQALSACLWPFHESSLAASCHAYPFSRDGTRPAAWTSTAPGRMSS